MCQNGDSWENGVSKMADQEVPFFSSSNVYKNDNSKKQLEKTVGNNFVGVMACNQRFTEVKQSSIKKKLSSQY